MLCSPSWLLFLFSFRLILVGEEVYTQMGFFVQTILADRYNHRRELWVVSLEFDFTIDVTTRRVICTLVLSLQLMLQLEELFALVFFS